MAASPLTMDAALALLDGYDDDDMDAATQSCLQLALPAVEASIAEIWTSGASATLSSPSSEDDAPTDRFRRARERKKRELSLLRAQSRGLEETLRRLKQQRLARHSGVCQLVWREAAARQLRERQEAEQLNAQLRAAVDASLRQTRRLRALLLRPDALEPLVHHKRLCPHPQVKQAASAVEWHGLLIALDLIEMQVDETLAKFQGVGESVILKPARKRRDGCHLVVEAFDASVVSYDVAAMSEGVWQKLAFEHAPEEACRADPSATVSRVVGMDVVNGSFQAFYTGSFVCRKRVLSDGRVVVLWASEWEPTGFTDWSDIFHESFRRQGFVCISPSAIDATRFTNVQTLYRIERDGCGDPSCERGACGDETVAKAEKSIYECVESEMKRVIQGVENDLMLRQNHGDSTLTHEPVLGSLSV